MAEKTIMIIGDVMLDKFSYGRVNRLNPESPAPLIKIEREEYKLWGAANVAANIVSLGKRAVLVGRIGADEHGQIFQNLCREQGIDFEWISYSGNPTITKVRIIETTYHQQLVRMDHENIVAVQNAQILEILSIISHSPPDLIVISDYDKGLITQDFAKLLIATWISVIADAKPGRLGWFHGALIVKPNFKEFSEHLGIKWENTDIFIEAHGKWLAQLLETNLVITRSEHGASIIERWWEIQHIPTEAQDIFDVTGAGDTFIAAMAIALAEWETIADAARFGNRASGVVVGKVGTATVTREELL